jgi:23S rRNA (adenine2503-C2)-methyltransferase
MPVAAGKWGLDELMETCREYTAETNRIITFEYTLVDGVNAAPSHCDALVRILRGLKCRVNLIPLNPTAHFNGRAPSREICEAFADRLTRAGINTTLRRSKGGGVNASCGQLRATKNKLKIES